jgi:hypothetical protein
MKTLLLLFILLGCSSNRFYQGPAVAQELRINEAALGLVMVSLQTDFEAKQTFFNNVRKISRDQFIMRSLNVKFRELKLSKEALMETTSYIKDLNEKLLKRVSEKDKIREGDPAFRAIENFAVDKEGQLAKLQKEYVIYEKTADEFENLAYYTRMVKI